MQNYNSNIFKPTITFWHYCRPYRRIVDKLYFSLRPCHAQYEIGDNIHLSTKLRCILVNKRFPCTSYLYG